ncbi:RHS repeat domain-containing protein, partial [Poritiphilus flavus]
WLFTKYDAFGRVAYTGMVSSTSSRISLQSGADSATAQYESRQTSSPTLADEKVLYSNSTYPNTLNMEIHTVNYYDSYADAASLSVPSTVLGQAKATNTTGLATVSKVRVLDPSATTGQADWITTISGYDKKGRVIYTASKNEYLGTTDVVETELDFAGKVKQTKTSHTKETNSAIVTTDTFTYDALGRLLKQEQTLGSHTELLAHNTYDGLGQLVKKQVGNTADSPLQVVDYSYNVRGWLKQINDPSSLGSDLFAFGINYNDTQYGGASLYNGNIAETAWKTANDNTLRRYRYEYDALNRLELAAFNLGDNSQPHRYSTSNITYDKNGNILTLTRKGHTNAGATSFGNMDVLDYDYHNSELSNKLYKVRDDGNDSYGFKDSTTDNQDYWYDANGNMVRDLNKGIGTSSADGISYNHLNLPIQIKFDNSDQKKISYIYDATGVKLRKVVEQPSVSSVTTDYAGNYIYENSTLQFFNHPEGYVEPDGSGGYDYVYQYKDHLGNIRLSYADDNGNGSIDPSSEIREENNYYPFGLQHKGYNSVVNSTNIGQNWRYNGKEIAEDLGLNIYDYGARNYDPAIGRWWQVDPLAEQMRRFSPYNFAWDNPIYFMDPDGMFAESFNNQRITDWYEDENGNIKYDENINSQKDLDDAGIDGTYIDESFTGRDQNGDLYNFGEDGSITQVDEGSVGDDTEVVAVTSEFVTTSEESVQAQGESRGAQLGAALVLSQGDSPAPGPADVFALGVIFNLLHNMVTGADEIQVTDQVLQFAKDAGESGGAEHTKGKRNSTKGKHERGRARKSRDRGGEKGDTGRRYPRKRPPGWKGPWPPKN